MSYKEKPQLKLYSYINEQFELQAIIDDYESVSIENNLYQAGQFLITINYNIPNALLFKRGMFIQFGNDPYNFGEIYNVADAVSSDGKAGQKRTISGYDARYLFKRRIIKNLNSNDTWNMTAKGEICLRSLIYSEAGEGAEEKRRLPVINTIPASENALGKEYTVSEAFTNLYDVLCTIATQSEIGWRIKFDGELTLEVYNGEDISDSVFFSTDFESLENGNFNDTSESYTNAVYVGGKGDGSQRDIYEGESAIEGSSPSSLDRFESWDNQSELTNESEYENEALSMLSQYGQNLVVSGNGLAKCPYTFKEQYNIGDTIKIAFSSKSANVQILSVTEFWQKGNYQTTFSFGKPQNNLKDQLQLILKKIQIASNKAKAIDSVMWYTIPDTLAMEKSEVTFNTIGFTGNVDTGKTFKLYIDDENTGSKNYNVYVKNLSGSGKLTLATDRTGSSGLELPSGSYVAQVYVDTDGNVLQKTISTVNAVESGNLHSVTSNAVAGAISDINNAVRSLNNLNIVDTRNENYTPRYYMSQRSRVWFDFKQSPTIGFFSGGYCVCITLVPWVNPSGGYPIQIAFNASDIGIRTGTGYDTWGSWGRVH